MAIGFGLVTATLFSAFRPAINRNFSLRQLQLALLCLRLLPPAAFVFVCVIAALLFANGAGRGCLGNAMAGRIADAAQPRNGRAHPQPDEDSPEQHCR